MHKAQVQRFSPLSFRRIAKQVRLAHKFYRTKNRKIARHQETGKVPAKENLPKLISWEEKKATIEKRLSGKIFTDISELEDNIFFRFCQFRMRNAFLDHAIHLEKKSRSFEGEESETISGYSAETHFVKNLDAASQIIAEIDDVLSPTNPAVLAFLLSSGNLSELEEKLKLIKRIFSDASYNICQQLDKRAEYEQYWPRNDAEARFFGDICLLNEAANKTLNEWRESAEGKRFLEWEKKTNSSDSATEMQHAASEIISAIPFFSLAAIRMIAMTESLLELSALNRFISDILAFSDELECVRFDGIEDILGDVLNRLEKSVMQIPGNKLPFYEIKLIKIREWGLLPPEQHYWDTIEVFKGMQRVSVPRIQASRSGLFSRVYDSVDVRIVHTVPKKFTHGMLEKIGVRLERPWKTLPIVRLFFE